MKAHFHERNTIAIPKNHNYQLAENFKGKIAMIRKFFKSNTRKPVEQNNIIISQDTSSRLLFEDND
jgi:hypothetical protein